MFTNHTLLSLSLFCTRYWWMPGFSMSQQWSVFWSNWLIFLSVPCWFFRSHVWHWLVHVTQCSKLSNLRVSPNFSALLISFWFHLHFPSLPNHLFYFETSPPPPPTAPLIVLSFGRKFTLLDAPSPRGGSCRYISRFVSWPTKAVRQLQLPGARQAECLTDSFIHSYIQLFRQNCRKARVNAYQSHAPV